VADCMLKFDAVDNWCYTVDQKFPVAAVGMMKVDVLNVVLAAVDVEIAVAVLRWAIVCY
jgi:hypothetical protein